MIRVVADKTSQYKDKEDAFKVSRPFPPSFVPSGVQSMAAIPKPRHAPSQSEGEIHTRMRFAFSEIFKHSPEERTNHLYLVGGLLASSIGIDYRWPVEVLEDKADKAIAEKTKAQDPPSVVSKSGATNICLELLDAAVKCSPIPGLEGVVKIARLIVTAVEEAEVNKAECKYLSKRVADVLLVIQGQAGVATDFEQHCKQLETELEEILREIQYIASHKKWTSFFRARELKERIGHCDKQLTDSLQLFHLKREIDRHKNAMSVSEMTQEQNPSQTQTQTNPDAHILPSTTAYRKESTDGSTHTVRSMVSRIPGFRSSTIFLTHVAESERQPPTTSSRSKQPGQPRRRNGVDDTGGRSSRRQYDNRRTRRDR